MHHPGSLSIESEPSLRLPDTLADGLNRRIGNGTLRLPLLPAVPMEVSRLASSDQGDVRAIADVIARDQSMAAHLLRLCNSPLYRGKVPMVTVQQAVARLGSSKIREVAMLIACEAGVFRARGFEREVKAQFRHSVACALFAQEIARNRRGNSAHVANVEEAFFAGLMHDVGQPVLLQALIDLQLELGVQVERAVVLAGAHAQHELAGAALCSKWNMSQRVIDAIEQHHSDTPLPSSVELVRTVQLADALAHHVIEPAKMPLASLTSHPALTALEVRADELRALIERGVTIGATAQAIG